MIFASQLKKSIAIISLALFSQSALAAYAISEYIGIASIITTGTATATLVSETATSAYGETDNGIPDSLNDGVTLSSMTSADGNGTAINDGFSSSSEADASNGVYSYAYTSSEIELEIGGEGLVIVLFDYVTYAEALEPGSYADAYIDIWSDSVGGYAYIYADYSDNGSDSSQGFLTLTFEGDPTGSYSQSIFIDTGASAYSPVPVPAAVWLLGSAILGLVTVGQRKR